MRMNRRKLYLIMTLCWGCYQPKHISSCPMLSWAKKKGYLYYSYFTFPVIFKVSNKFKANIVQWDRNYKLECPKIELLGQGPHKSSIFRHTFILFYGKIYARHKVCHKVHYIFQCKHPDNWESASITLRPSNELFIIPFKKEVLPEKKRPSVVI